MAPIISFRLERRLLQVRIVATIINQQRGCVVAVLVLLLLFSPRGLCAGGCL